MKRNPITYPYPKFGWVAAILLLLILSTMCHLAMANDLIVRIGVYENPPKIFLTEEGKPAGIFIDIIECIAQKEGWQIRYVPGAWGEGLDRLKKGEIDLMPDVAYTADREQTFDFHNTPVLSSWFQVYARKGLSIRSLLDLEGKRISVLDRSVQKDAFSAMTSGFGVNATVISLPDYKKVFEMVAEGKVDAAITNRFYGLSHAKKYGLEDTAVIFHPTNLFFAARKGAPRQLLETLDNHLSNLKSDLQSAYYDSVKRWIGEEVHFKLPDWVKVIILGALVVLLMSLTGSVILKRLVALRTRELQQANLEMGKEVRARKGAEENLKLIATKLQMALASSNIGLWDWDLQTNDVWFSPELKRQIGYDDNEIPNRYEEWEKRLHPEDRPKVMDKIEKYLQGHVQVHDVEFRLAHKDGSYRWIKASGKLVFQSRPKARRFMGSHVDITERKQAEEALAANYNLLRIAGETARFGGWRADLNNNICTWSETAADIHDVPSGYSPSLREAIGFYAPEWGERITQVFADCSEKGIPYDEEMEIITRKGRRVWVRTTGEPVRNEKNEIAGVQGSFQDITAQKRTGQEREKLQAQLLQAQKMEAVGRLAGGVAHDYNNMLSVIIGYTELALDKVTPGDSLREDLEEVFKAASRSADITRQLLAFARKQTIAPKVIDLNEAVEGMLKMLRRLIGEDIDLFWQPRPGRMPVFLDPSQLDQLLANLCVNARDAIEGVGKLTIETAHVRFDEEYCAGHAGFIPGDFILLAVSDDGCGMDEAVLENIFEPFFTTKGVCEGTGLGLSTVFGIVKQNNGFINVYSEPDKGTTFKIYLPLFAGEDAGLTVQETTEIPTGHGETVLVVEDETPVLKLVQRILEPSDYTVLTAATPGEAMALAETHAGEIHLLITDVVMPEMNGRELAEHLHARYPGLKVLFMSGYTANVIAHRGILEKSVNFIQKPFSNRDLSVKVREALGCE